MAPLPLLFALVARFFSPPEAHDIAADWLFRLVFQGLLPLLAVLAGSRSGGRGGEGAPPDWRPGLALLACTSGALLGLLLMEPRGIVEGTQIPALSWTFGVTLPVFATGLLASRILPGLPAALWAAATFCAGVAAAFACAAALHLDDSMAGNGLAAGGAVWTVLAVALGRSTPRWRYPGPTLLLAGSLTTAVPAATVVIWLGTPPVESFVPYDVRGPVTRHRPVVVEAFAPRAWKTRMVALTLDDGTVTPLPRRVDRICELSGGEQAVHLQGIGRGLPLMSFGPRVAVLSTDGLHRLPGYAKGEFGLLQCSSGDQVLWVAGSTMTVWEIPSERSWTVEAEGGDIAFPCFTVQQAGVLYRIRGDAPPPYPRHFLPLDETTPADDAVDTARCTESWYPSSDIWFERPNPHSGQPWRIHDAASGTTVEIVESVRRVTYLGQDQAFALLRDENQRRTMTHWIAGQGLVARWPCPGANEVHGMHEGRAVLLIRQKTSDPGPTWELLRSTDGARLRQGTSQKAWPVDSTDLLELRDGALILQDLDGEAPEVQLMPRLEETP